MGFWGTLLDGIVKRQTTPPAFVRTLGLPGITRWEPGRVWSQWKVDPGVFHNGGAVFGGEGLVPQLLDDALDPHELGRRIVHDQDACHGASPNFPQRLSVDVA